MSAAAGPETLVLGGGLAGAAAATALARAGHRVRLLERERAPVDKMCGEFLSVEAQAALARLGCDLDRLGASRIATLRLAWGARTIEAGLPFVARGLTRRRLDAALLDEAARAGVAVERGVTVRAVSGARVETSHGDLLAERLLLASGKHELRGLARDARGCDTAYVGFKTYWRLDPRAVAALSGRIDVILFDGGYAGLQLVEDGVANLCLLVTRRRLAALGGRWEDVRAMLFAQPGAAALRDAVPILPRPLAIAGVPYGYLHRAAPGESCFRLGDQAAVIPSFCGEGMAIALHSAALAARVVAAGGAPDAYHRALRAVLAPRIRLAVGLQRLGAQPWSRALLWSALRLRPALVAPLARRTRVPG